MINYPIGAPTISNEVLASTGAGTLGQWAQTPFGQWYEKQLETGLKIFQYLPGWGPLAGDVLRASSGEYPSGNDLLYTFLGIGFILIGAYALIGGTHVTVEASTGKDK